MATAAIAPAADSAGASGSSASRFASAEEYQHRNSCPAADLDRVGSPEAAGPLCCQSDSTLGMMNAISSVNLVISEPSVLTVTPKSAWCLLPLSSDGIANCCISLKRLCRQSNIQSEISGEDG